MGFFRWITSNWFTLLQSAGIIGSLLFTAFSLRIDAKVRRVGNLLQLTEGHRNIWSELYARPALARLLDANADLSAQPVTPEEELFVHFLILHLSGAHRAAREDVLTSPEGLHRDIAQFFALPIPEQIWRNAKAWQDRDFVIFVEACLAGEQATRRAPRI